MKGYYSAKVAIEKNAMEWAIKPYFQKKQPDLTLPTPGLWQTPSCQLASGLSSHRGRTGLGSSLCLLTTDPIHQQVLSAPLQNVSQLSSLFSLFIVTSSQWAPFRPFIAHLLSTYSFSIQQPLHACVSVHGVYHHLRATTILLFDLSSPKRTWAPWERRCPRLVHCLLSVGTVLGPGDPAESKESPLSLRGSRFKWCSLHLYMPTG